MKLRAGDTLVVASHNPGKVREIRELLMPFRLHVVGANELELEEPEENETTFAGNAALKARAAAHATGHPALADDSGLMVRALGGAPGIYSARWAGPDKDFAQAMKRVETELLTRVRPTSRPNSSARSRWRRRMRMSRFSKAKSRARSSFHREECTASATTRSRRTSRTCHPRRRSGRSRSRSSSRMACPRRSARSNLRP